MENQDFFFPVWISILFSKETRPSCIILFNSDFFKTEQRLKDAYSQSEDRILLGVGVPLGCV